MNDSILRQQVKDHKAVISSQQRQIDNLNESIENLLVVSTKLLIMVEELEKRLTSRIVAIEEVL